MHKLLCVLKINYEYNIEFSLSLPFSQFNLSDCTNFDSFDVLLFICLEFYAIKV